VTARNFDVGALIGGTGASMASGSSASSSATIAGSASAGSQGGELFRVAQIERLRILVTVPQDNAFTVHAGLPAKVLVPQYGSRVFDGTVTRTANALDAASRTMLTEIQVANRDGVLLPGMYAQAEFENTRSSPPLIVPGDTILARANGTQIAMLVDPRPEDRDHLQGADREQVKQVHLQTVQIGRDYGTTVEIVGGLDGWEHIIVNPGDNAVENTLVLPHEAPAAAGTPPATGGTPTDRAPGGIASPGQAAPTQGPVKPGGTQRGGQPRDASPAKSVNRPETRGR
jgi:multidrug efflux pump subunit AcrA (membrane-fusion protein)